MMYLPSLSNNGVYQSITTLMLYANIYPYARILLVLIVFYFLAMLFIEYHFLFSAYNLHIFIFVWCLLLYVSILLSSQLSRLLRLAYVSTNFYLFCFILCSFLSNLATYILFFIPLYTLYNVMYHCTYSSFTIYLSLFYYYILSTVNVFFYYYTEIYGGYRA